MKGILVVFMTQYLMNHGGELDLMSNAEATEKYHLFTAAVYFTPLLGALIADLFFGKYLTIIALSLVYCLGHGVLALDDTRMGLALGLGLIALGAGGIKPCVSAHVGDQFGETNQPLLSKVFGWFYVSINIGAFLSNLLTPYLLQNFGPQYAFGLPGGLMLLATIVFWMGRKEFVHIPAGGKDFLKEVFTVEGLKALGKLSIIYVFVAMFWALFDQTGSTWVLQARSMDREILGFTLFEAQFQAANPLLILILVPTFTFIVYPAISSVFPLTPLRKISIGCFITVIAFAVPAMIETNITGGKLQDASSQASKGDWSPWNLIDDAEGATNGWASKVLPAAPVEGEPLATIDFRLRERTAWTINAVEINPYVTGIMNADDAPAAEGQAFADLSRLAKDVSVHVADASGGPWTQVATISLTQEDAYQAVTFPEVEAAYVRLQVDSNHGGQHAVMHRIRILSPDSTPPAGAAPTAMSAWPDVAAIGHKPFILWQLLAYVLITAAEVMISITCLEFSYTQAPRQMKSFIMAFYMMSVSVGNLIVAFINKFIQNDDGTTKLEGASYYWMFTGLMLATALAFVVVAKLYREKTYIQEEGPKEAGFPADEPEP
jgi:dipeptide/tripeptide permease